jgi:hypothetical protein
MDGVLIKIKVNIGYYKTVGEKAGETKVILKWQEE